MAALRARFNAGKAGGNGIVYRPIVAQLEVQAVMVFDGTPVSAIKSVTPDEVQGARDVAAIAFGHDKKDVPGHGFANEREEITGEIRRTPLAAAGVEIEVEERIPMMFFEV